MMQGAPLANLISTRIHGILDYLGVVTLFALPRLLDWPPTLTLLLTGAAVLLLASSLFTRYELGLVRVLPMRAHLALDVIAGVALIVAGMTFQDAQPGVFGGLLLLGLFEIGAGTLTSPRPSFEEQLSTPRDAR
jgi:hypothetical protein